jgi:hypothetical protein
MDLPSHRGILAFDHLLHLGTKQAFCCQLRSLPLLSRLGRSRLSSLLGSSRPLPAPSRATGFGAACFGAAGFGAAGGCSRESGTSTIKEILPSAAAATAT